VDEITLVGSRCGPFAPALALLASGRVDPRPLVEARYPLAEAVRAFDHAARPGALKVLVDCT
jgi:threonine dehydrogenase-like Zn-dependent dehydrogenase